MKTRLLASAAALFVAAVPAHAFDDAQKEEIGQIVREYLLANPEIIEEVQIALEQKKEAEAKALAEVAITTNAKALFNSPHDVALGNPEGDVTIVEFFDYNCGFCKRAFTDMNEIIGKDKNVRFVLKEFPILGPDSLAAHHVSMSFRKLMPEKYGDFHSALLGSDQRATEARAIEIATGLGADEAALREGMKAPEIEDSIREAYELANALGINGTPSYVIGDEAVFGALGADVLVGKINNMRQCQSTVC